MIDELMKQGRHTPLFSLAGEVMIGKCVKCYDADSVHIVVNYRDRFNKFKCRLADIDTPELRTSNLLEKKIAKEARNLVRKWIEGKLVLIKCGSFDKYGRLLIYIYPYINNNPTISQLGGDLLGYNGSINERLVDQHYACKYDGGKKTPFQDWYKPVISKKI